MNKSEKGLTMIELLLTIAILVATTTFVLVLGDRSISQTGLFAAHTQATFLAKEAMEVLENETIRNQINGEGDSLWMIDYQKIEGPKTEEECNEKIRIDGEGFFSIDGDINTETSFSRCVRAQKSANDLKIEVNVTFNYRNNDYSISLYRIFYD